MKSTPERTLRNAIINMRVTPEEKNIITAKAEAQGQTVTDFLRQRALDYRLRQTALEKERIRELARIGANINQLARWANTYKRHVEAVQILMALASLEHAIKTDTKTDANTDPEEDKICI